mgnify:CR=1 FL=1
MGINIGLVGNPNSGKTTMFNSLTGSNQYVGNWPGVTIEKKTGKLKGHNDITVTDLPGIYSLSPNSMEEIITRNFLLEDDIDVIINIVDATNLERNLYLTTQILEMDKPVVIALNFLDVLEKRNIKINIDELSKLIGCPVILTSALKSEGLEKLCKITIEVAKKPRNSISLPYTFQTIKALEKIKSLANITNQYYAVRLLDQDEIITKKYKLENNQELKDIIHKYERENDTDSQSAIVEERYRIIEMIVKATVDAKKAKLSTTEKIDKVLINRWLAIPIFLGIMFLVYYISIVSVGELTVQGMEYFFDVIIGENVRSFLLNANVAEWMISLIVDGIIAGVGGVLTFVPQMIILFLFLSLLEDTGYMARVAFIMDSIFRKFGLSGKSFIPMLIGTGCSVPGIMAARTIEDERDRALTIILTPFIPCGAKLPIFALFVGVFFGPLASVSMYLLGIVVVIIAGVILKHTKYFGGERSSFVLELPEYHLPSIKGTLSSVWDRSKAFIIKAGTIIFIASVIIWILQSFSWNMHMVANHEESILASIGKFIAPIFAPLGFGNWEATVAILTSFAAKENVVSTFEILSTGVSLNTYVSTLFTPLSGYAFMAFILLAPPCFASLSTMKKELPSVKLTLFAIGFQFTVAYIIALLIFQGGKLYNQSSALPTILISLIIIVFMALIIKHKVKNRGCSGCYQSNCKHRKE